MAISYRTVLSSRHLCSRRLPGGLWPALAERQAAKPPGRGRGVLCSAHGHGSSAGYKGTHSASAVQQRHPDVRGPFPLAPGSQHSGNLISNPRQLYSKIDKTEIDCFFLYYFDIAPGFTAVPARSDGWIFPLWAAGEIPWRSAFPSVYASRAGRSKEVSLLVARSNSNCLTSFSQVHDNRHEEFIDRPLFSGKGLAVGAVRNTISSVPGAFRAQHTSQPAETFWTG